MSYQYAYLCADLLLLPLWLFLFFHRKDCRKEILIAGFLVGIAAIVTEPFFLKDYWSPQLFNGWSVGLEDFLYGFFIGGIASVIYEEFYGKRFSKRHTRKHHWNILLFPFCVLSFLVFYFSKITLDLNTMYAALISLIFGAIFITYYRKDLIADSLMSGFLIGLVTLIGFYVFIKLFPGVIQAWWKLDNLSGIFIAGVPIEEILWALGVGMVAGPFYEFFMGLKILKRSN